jgi:hypothetical protein
VQTGDYATVRPELLERIKNNLEDHHIPLTVVVPPLPQVVPPAAS